jgi:hypothetical protein
MTDLFERCIFCGQVPDELTDEHTIPRWLIRMTGEADRRMHYGAIHTPGQRLKQSQQPFGRHKFPACGSCNKSYGKMEELARHAVERLSSAGTLTAREIEDLADWVDKMRLGCWFSQIHSERNQYQINPKFFISDMVGRSDSLLWVFVARESYGRLNVFGGGPDFVCCPSSFAVFIANVAIVQYSEQGAGQRLLPELQRSSPAPSDSYELEVAEKFSHLFPGGWPVISPGCAQIFRPRQRSYLGDGRLDSQTELIRGFYRPINPRLYHMAPFGLLRVKEGVSFHLSNLLWDDADQMRLQALKVLYRVRKHVVDQLNSQDAEQLKVMRVCAAALVQRFESMSAADLIQDLSRASVLSISIPPEA